MTKYREGDEVEVVTLKGHRTKRAAEDWRLAKIIKVAGAGYNYCRSPDGDMRKTERPWVSYEVEFPDKRRSIFDTSDIRPARTISRGLSGPTIELL